ncbi:ABC transporter permease subunit [Palleronia sp.]|uniref:ABC transporter permease subunit n=1 Tax=Palleronia sp. TaxID=1940284 RepID=UPI0035C7E9A1
MTVAAVAAKEIREGLRNRWIVAITLLLGILALALSFLGSAPTGSTGASPLEVMVVSLSSLTIFLVPLIALLLSHDAVVGEAERGTLLLLLSYPVARWQIVLGKFLGHLVILAVATTIGYGAAGLALGAFAGGLGDGWGAFARMIANSIGLGAAFLAIGYAVSALARERGVAAGMAVGLWLLFALVYDMILLGALVVDQGAAITPGVLNALLLLNPADVYRLLNLAGSADASMFAGMSGLAADASLDAPILVLALVCWIAVPLALASALFSRRQL